MSPNCERRLIIKLLTLEELKLIAFLVRSKIVMRAML